MAIVLGNFGTMIKIRELNTFAYIPCTNFVSFPNIFSCSKSQSEVSMCGAQFLYFVGVYLS